MAEPSKDDGGQDRVIAAAQLIVKNLATSKNAADDMIRILSGFDDRLSSIHNHDLFHSPSSSSAADEEGAASAEQRAAAEQSAGPSSSSSSSLDARLENAERLVLRWDLSDSFVWDAAAAAAIEYLATVDEIISLADDPQFGDDLRDRIGCSLQMAMSRLEEEFRHLMARNAVPLDYNGLFSSIRRLSLSFASESGEPIEDLEGSAVHDELRRTDSNQQQPPSPSQLLQESESPQDRLGSSLMDDRDFNLVHPEALADLKAIADRMIRALYDRELGQVYCSVRRDILDECLLILGVERMSIDEVQRIEWQMLDEKMKKWIQALKILFRPILHGEKRLCDHLLGASDKLAEECFAEIAKGCILQLLNFGDAIAICQRSSEKLFRILDMYEALAEVLPDMQDLFSAELKDVICNEADGLLKRLGDAVKGTLLEFENAIRSESSRKPTLSGEIHPLARYVMNYMRLLVVYKDLLDSLLDDSGIGGGHHVQSEGRGSESGDGQCLESMSPLGQRLCWLISYLESNLEEKAKLYEDGALQYIFLMNHILYIVQKVKDSELGRLLGDHWIRKRRSRIRQLATSYLRTSWAKVLNCLKDEGLGTGSGSSHGISKVILKERFKSFNLAFEEIYRVQTTWKVPDPQLREELRISISEMVIPAYRSFTGRFSGQLEGRHAVKHLKYTAEDMESNLSDLFEGLSTLTNHPRRKT